MNRLLGLSSLLALAACAPAPRQVVMTPEFLDHAPRYRLVAPPGNDTMTVRQVAQAVQQELAERGMLLAAPWETPTLQVAITSVESRVPYQRGVSVIPVAAYHGGCVDAAADPGHCTPLDGPSLYPASPVMVPVLQLSLRIQKLGTGETLLARSMIAQGSERGIPVYQARYLVKQALGGFSP